MNFLDCDIWCICLKNREDRYKNSLIEFNKIGIAKKVKYYRPNKDSRGGRIGCWLSFIYCMEQSVKKNKSYMLIFEDDIKFTDNWKNEIHNIKIFLEFEPDWDVLRLGSYLTALEKPSISTKTIWKCRSIFNHAIIFNINFVKKLLKDRIIYHPEKTIYHLDEYIEKDCTVNNFSLINQICYQDLSLGTDNDWAKNNFILSKINFNNKIFYYITYINQFRNSIKWYLRFLPVEVQRNTDMTLIVIIVILIIIVLLMKLVIAPHI